MKTTYRLGTFADFSSGGRMRAAHTYAGQAVNAYLHDRWSCAAH